jgi:hypothetical protein
MIQAIETPNPFTDINEAIQHLGERSYLYQYQVVDNVFQRLRNRRKQTPITKKNIRECKNWLQNYKELKDKTLSEEYPFLSLEQVQFWLPLAERYHVAEVSRGVKHSPNSPIDKNRGFIQVYKEAQGKKNNLAYIPIKFDKPNGPDWYTFRQQFLHHRLLQYSEHNPLILYYSPQHPTHPCLPTPEHVELIMNGYSPDPHTLSFFSKQ